MVFLTDPGGWRSGAGRRGPTAGRLAPRGAAGDEDLAEGAVGEGGECLGRAVERDGGLDVDAEGARGDLVEQGGELVGGGGGHDRRDGDVRPRDLLGAGAAGGGDGAAGLQGRAEGGGVAGGVQDLVDALRCDGRDRGGDVAGVVDGVRSAEAADVLLLPGAGGADDGRPGGGSELDGDGADAAGRAGDEHGLARLDAQRLQGVVGGHARQADDGGVRRVDAGGHGGDGGRGQCDVLGEGAVAGAEGHSGDDAGDPLDDRDAVDAV
ncbi:MAG TPA: hypothetical protein VF640_00795, partial [Acidimicrobiales bacterium]